MKSIRFNHCLAVLALFAGYAAQAADGNAVSGSAASSGRTTHSSGKALPVTKSSARPPSPVAEAANVAIPMQSAQLVYQVLLAEIALQRGDVLLSSNAYADLALRTRDPEVLARAVEVAGFARRLDLAQEIAQLWVEVEPNSQKAGQMLASVLILSNRFDDLAPHLSRLLEADKAVLGENLLGLNRMLARNPDRQAVFQLIEKVCRPFFGVAEAHYAVAMAAGSAGMNERALSEAKRALELRPDWEMAALLQAQILSHDSNGEALEFLQAYSRKYPQASDVRLQLARKLVGEKRYADARQHFELLLQTYPNNPEVVFPSAVLALQQNDRGLAETRLKHLLTLPMQDKSFAYYYLGMIADEGGRAEEALAHYAQVGAGEHYLQAQLRRARILVDQGRMDEARKQLGAAKSGSADETIHLAIAEAGLLRDARQPQAAFDLLEALLSKRPDQPDLLYETALLAEKIGRNDILESRLRKLIELRPDNPQAYNALGYSYAERNIRLDEARALIEKALQLSPDDFFILDSMGWVLYRQGELSAALIYLEKALALRDDPEVAAHIGEVLWALGRQDEARRLWSEAQKKYPDNQALVEAIKKFTP